MYLSNNRGGRPSKALFEYKRSDLEGRRKIADREDGPSLVIWQLHDCASSAPYDPPNTLPYAELALELAEPLDDQDLLSWACSELGNVHRLLHDYEKAKHYLDQGISLALNSYQKADAIRQRGELSLTVKNDARAAILLQNRAYEISMATTPRIQSDRGHPMVLQSKALAHLWHAALHNESHLELAIPLLETVLDTACRRHAPRARRAALNNLVAIPLTHDRPIERPLVKRLTNAYSSLRQKSSLLGARIRWVLLRVEIREKGYTEGRRRRLLTVREQIVSKRSYRLGGLLTLDIALHDIKEGRPRRVRQLLGASRPLLEQGGLEELSYALVNGALTEETVMNARREAITRCVVGSVAAGARRARS